METVRNTHYHRNNIEVEDIIDQVFEFYGDDLSAREGFYIGNIIKYLMRYKFKGDPIGDLKKLQDYVFWLEADERELSSDKEC